MNWLLSKLGRYLFGPGCTDELLDGVELAIQEEFTRIMAQEA